MPATHCQPKVHKAWRSRFYYLPVSDTPAMLSPQAIFAERIAGTNSAQFRAFV